MITTKQLLANWYDILKNRNNNPEPHHFNLGNYEFIGTVTDYKLNGIMIDHYIEKFYEIKDLYPSFIFMGIENTGVE